jgi:hypothetical protein
VVARRCGLGSHDARLRLSQIELTARCWGSPAGSIHQEAADEIVVRRRRRDGGREPLGTGSSGVCFDKVACKRAGPTAGRGAPGTIWRTFGVSSNWRREKPTGVDLPSDGSPMLHDRSKPGPTRKLNSAETPRIQKSREMLKPLERVKGIEPSYSAWKAAALPLSYTRVRRGTHVSITRVRRRRKDRARRDGRQNSVCRWANALTCVICSGVRFAVAASSSASTKPAALAKLFHRAA